MTGRLPDVRAHLRRLSDDASAIKALADAIENHVPEALKEPSTEGVSVTPAPAKKK